MVRMKGCGSYEREWWRNNGLKFNRNKRGLVFSLSKRDVIHMNEGRLVNSPNSFTREATFERPFIHQSVMMSQLRTLGFWLSR